MSTRLALVLAVILLALALVQWRLRSAAEDSGRGSVEVPVVPAAVAVDTEIGTESLEDIEEPVIDIPEYVPPPITERPKTPVQFSAHELEIDLGIPRVEGKIDEDPAGSDGD